MQEAQLSSAGREPTAMPVPRRLPTSLRAFLLAVLVSALLTSLFAIVQALSPRPAWRFLLPTVFLVALESVYTTHWIRHPDRRQLNRAAYRLAEFVVIALILRLLTWMITGGLPGIDAWRGYLLSPLAFFDGVYFIYLLAALIAWERGITLSSHFDRLGLSHAEIAFYSLAEKEQRARYEDRPISQNRRAIFASLIQQWVRGGFLLALAAAITSLDVATVVGDLTLRNISRLGLSPTILAGLLIYFLLGLWLISQARLTMMRARWITDGVDAPPEITRTWNRLAFLLLFLIAFAAAFLPIGSTIAVMPLLELLTIITVGFVQLLLVIITTVLYFLVNLFGFPQEVEGEPPVGPLGRPTPEVPPQLSPLSDTVSLILGGILWIVVAVIVAVALIFFLQDRGYPIGTTTLRRLWESFSAWLQSFWRGASRQASTLSRAVRGRLRRGETADGSASTRWRFVRVNALPPREQVRFFYLSTVRRAGEKGVERAPSETPSEYADDLRENWPEAEQEIVTLTGAFLKARYSAQPFSKKDVNPVKRVWKQVRGTLRRRRGDR